MWSAWVAPARQRKRAGHQPCVGRAAVKLCEDISSRTLLSTQEKRCGPSSKLRMAGTPQIRQRTVKHAGICLRTAIKAVTRSFETRVAFRLCFYKDKNIKVGMPRRFSGLRCRPFANTFSSGRISATHWALSSRLVRNSPPQRPRRGASLSRDVATSPQGSKS